MNVLLNFMDLAHTTIHSQKLWCCIRLKLLIWPCDYYQITANVIRMHVFEPQHFHMVGKRLTQKKVKNTTSSKQKMIDCTDNFHASLKMLISHETQMTSWVHPVTKVATNSRTASHSSMQSLPSAHTTPTPARH